MNVLDRYTYVMVPISILYFKNTIIITLFGLFLHDFPNVDRHDGQH